MQNMTPPLKGKVAVVTGATGGIGEAVCHALANAGATVVVGYNRSAEAAEALAGWLLAPAGIGHLALAMPVTDSSALQVAAATVVKKLSRVDILVNCAGTTRFVPHSDLDALDDSLIDAILSTNVRGTFAAIRAFRDALAANQDGLIVNITSVAAQTALGSNVMYCASKAAVDNMTRSLARALAPAVRVVSVAPGLVDTAFVKSLDVDWRDEQVRLTPLGRLATPNEVANAVLAVATLLRFTTGVAIPVDGGRPLR